MGSGKAEPIQADCRWNDSSQQSSNKKYVNFKVLEHKSRQWVFIKIFTSSNCWSSEWPLFFGVRSWWGRKCTHHISGRATGEEQGGAPATIPTPGSPAQYLQGPGEWQFGGNRTPSFHCSIGPDLVLFAGCWMGFPTCSLDNRLRTLGHRHSFLSMLRHSDS